MSTDLILPSDFPRDEALFQYLENEEKRKEAYIRYVGQEMKPSAIAAEIAVPVNTVRQWIVRGAWHKRVLEARQQRAQEEEFALALFRDDNRLDEVKAQLKAGRKGQELVLEMLEEGGLGPGQLKQLGEALKNFADLAARAVGVGETVETKTSADDAKGDTRARLPPIIINAGSVTVADRPN